MRVIRKGDIEPREVTADGEGNAAEGTCVQVLVPEGPNFVMRVFTLRPGGHTPEHTHPWEHQVYVLSGKARISGASVTDLAPGDAVYVPPDEAHSFANVGNDDVQFICIVPRSAGGGGCGPGGPGGRDDDDDCGKRSGSR